MPFLSPVFSPVFSPVLPRVLPRLFLTGLLLAFVSPLQAEPPPPSPLPLDELRSFAEVYERIKQAYVDEVDDKTLLENAIRGMLGGLDPHSGYLDAAAFRQLRESTQGEFGGLGIEVTQENGRLKIVSPIDDTPASRAGLQPLDWITHINDIKTNDLSLTEAITRLRGTPGTSVRLTIQRTFEQPPFTVELTRDLIRALSVRHELLESGYAYLRISQFQNSTGEEVNRALETLKKANQDEAFKGVILDLRNNPGGVLQAAVEVAGLFLDGGLIVYTQGRLPDAAMRFKAPAGDRLQGTPLVVLMNSGSASAAEIVAGALQDHRRALIMGRASFGKGSVQTVLPLRDDRGLKMTTALYYTPKGRSIQAEGIMPDILVANARITAVEERPLVREVDLQGHLQSGQNLGVSEQADQSPSASTLINDYPVNEALNLLKGLYFFSKTSTL